jgi:hypothetical protein
MSPKHIVIIGAARSGTKMLRAALATASGAGAVPYDIGYVWRVGNERARDDALDPSQITERGCRFIRRFIDGYAAGEDPTVIEKTVGNTLRVPFVARVLPDARYIHLIRDGVDVAESSRRQWTAGSDWRYLAQKVRHVPARLAPRYGAKYVASLASRAFQQDRRLGSWGPRYPGIDADLASHQLLVVCARQWRESVLAATQAFWTLGLPVYEIRYEDLVADPGPTLAGMSEFLRLPMADSAVQAAASAIDHECTGSGRRALSTESGVLESEIGDTLAGLGYDRAAMITPGLRHERGNGGA